MRIDFFWKKACTGGRRPMRKEISTIKIYKLFKLFFNDYLASGMCVLKDFNCIFAEFGMSAERYYVRDDK